MCCIHKRVEQAQILLSTCLPVSATIFPPNDAGLSVECAPSMDSPSGVAVGQPGRVMDQPSKYRIFISSTTEELKEYREATSRAIEGLGHEPVGLELTEASERSPLQRSKEMIASCDVLISLIGHGYGFVPVDNNPHQYSFIEIELRYAWEIGKPTLIFMVSDDIAWPSRFVERDAQRVQHLENLRKEVLGRVVVAFFTSPDDLAIKVTTAVAKLHIRKPQTPDPLQGPLSVPPGVDPFELAWRLVVDFKAEPALLAHMDPSELLRATQQWAREARPDEPLDVPRIFESAQTHLRSKQAELGPSPLWLAWKRSTGLRAPPPSDD